MDSLYTRREMAYLVTQHLPVSRVKILMSAHHSEDAAIESAARLSAQSPHLHFEVHVAVFDAANPLMEFHKPVRHAKETELEL